MNKILKKSEKQIKRWAKKCPIKKLEDLVAELKDVYYNSPDKFDIPDDTYDILEDSLRSRKPKSEALKIGAKLTQDKVKLPYNMYSLDKVKSVDAVDKFIKNTSSPYVASDKLDGVSILVTKDKGIYKLYTRGDGTYGKDISGFASHLKGLPDIKKVPEGFVGRGEMIMPVARFNKWVDLFANPRNLVAGVTNRKDIHKAVKDVQVIMYERMDKKLRPSKQLESLKRLGFKVVDYTPYSLISYDILFDHLNVRKKTAKTEIDGIVIYEDKPHTAPSGNPKYAVAFKVNAESDIKTVTVVDVVWQLSRQGRYTPVIKIEPTKMQGVTVTNVTAHNGENIVKNGIGKGAVVRIIRSGDVIPFIVDVIKKGKVVLPKDSEMRGAFLYAKDTSNLDDVQLRAITHFFTVIGVDGFKIGSVSKMYEEGYTTVAKLLKAKQSDFKSVLGINGDKIYKSIQECIDGVDLAVLMTASGFFDNLSYTRINLLLESVPQVAKDVENGKSSVSVDDLIIPTIGSELAKSFLKGLPDFIKWLKKQNIDYVVPVKKKPKKGVLSKEVIIFTKVRDKEMEQQLINKGATIKNSFTKEVTAVITKDVNDDSGKLSKARELGIPIYNLAQAKKVFKL